MLAMRPGLRNPQVRQRLGRIAWMVALLAALAVPSHAAEWQLSGEVGHYLFYSTGQDSLLQNELRYEIAVRGRLNWDGQVYVRWKGAAALSQTEDAAPLFEKPPSSPWPSLDEAYVDVYLSAVDLRIGRQVVHWGTADGINPTDVVNPRSVSLDALVNRETHSRPVPAVQAAVYPGGAFGLTVVGVTDFVPAPFPEEAVRELAMAAALKAGGLDTEWLSLEEPGPGGRYELAVRAETMLAGYNLYLSYFNGFDDYPALWMQPTQPPTPTGWRVYGQYRRQQQFGLAAAGTIGESSVWAEVAYTLPERVEELEASPIALSSNRGNWMAVVGADRTFAGDVYVSGQLVSNQAGSLLLPYHPPGEEDGLYALGLVRYGPQSNRTWEALVFANLRDGGTVVSPGLTYELRPGIELTARYVTVVGSDTSEFGRLRSRLQGLATHVGWSF